MTTADGPDRGDTDRRLAEFVSAWAKALAGTCYVPMTRAERHEFLHGLAARLHAAISAEPFTTG